MGQDGRANPMARHYSRVHTQRRGKAILLTDGDAEMDNTRLLVLLPEQTLARGLLEQAYSLNEKRYVT